MSAKCSVMERLWSLPAQYDTWLAVWKMVAQVQGEMDIITTNEAEHIQQANILPGRVAHYEATMQHDLNAALRAAQESICSECAQRIHYGLTSSDIVDTALSLRMKRSAEHLLAVCSMGHRRLVYPWEESITLLRRAIKEISVGKISGAVGTHATIPGGPGLEAAVLERLGLRTTTATQVVPRDHHAAYALALAGVALAHGGRETASVMIALENVPLWHERDISHSSNERIYLPQLCQSLDDLLHQAANDPKGWK